MASMEGLIKPQSIRLSIVCSVSTGRVSTRAWKSAQRKALGQTPAIMLGLKGLEQPTSIGKVGGLVARPHASRVPSVEIFT